MFQVSIRTLRACGKGFTCGSGGTGFSEVERGAFVANVALACEGVVGNSPWSLLETAVG